MISESPTQRQWTPTQSDPVPPPPFRRLRGYAFDPSLSMRLETAVVNETAFNVRWEKPADPALAQPPFAVANGGGDGLYPGPVGEYVEVVDFDPASECFYDPVDLNSPLALAQDGLTPSEGNPQFHQQMVYAVAMTTIDNFERALGRWALWSPHLLGGESSTEIPEDYHSETDAPTGDFVRRLRIYPHALREPNAFYSPRKKALLFGYFPATHADPGDHIPGGTVFTCLSHDIVAHETTHALLDGMHRRFLEASNPDVLAFHEAFADIVALFQHFTFPEVLRHQIAKTRGDLASQNLLGELAQEFGRAIGHYGALRSAIGETDPKTGRWQPKRPDPEDYHTVLEPHDRGAILVAAVFDAFISIYRRRTADLIRIATSGTGVLPDGDLHPDLVNRLAQEAGKSAQHVLTICIRALDYLPPVDVTFGEYLRALITADADLVSNDDLGYRVAFVEAFRRRGIYPMDVRTLSVDSLRWQGVRDQEQLRAFGPLAERLRLLLQQLGNTAVTREDVYNKTRDVRLHLHKFIREDFLETTAFEVFSGLFVRRTGLPGLELGSSGLAKFVVHSLRPVQRIGPDGEAMNQVIISLTQKRTVGIEHGVPIGPEPTMTFRGGSTLILDLNTLRVRYAIRKRIDSQERLDRQRRYMRDGFGASLRATYLADVAQNGIDEPFALLHRSLPEAV